MSCEPLKCTFKINVPTNENYLDGVDIDDSYKKFFESTIFTTDYTDVLGSAEEKEEKGIIYSGVNNLLNHQMCNDTCRDIWASCPAEQEDETFIDEEEATDEETVEEEDTNEIPMANTFLKSTSTRNMLTQKPCNQLKYYAVQELKSTAYMLRVLTQSVIGEGNINFNITANIEKLKGRWKEDNQFINMSEGQENGNGKLIMGFGPSAAGKSYMAEKIVDIMRKTDPSFPKFFLNIDGGNYRQYSAVYQRVLKAIEDNVIERCYIGIENLKKSINTSKIKKNVMDYLMVQRTNNPKLQINLYVPDTLTSCDLKFGCKKKIKKYLDITQSKNEWIASMVYQHETGDICPFKENYKCLGTTTSGVNREKCESKKYEGGRNYKKGYELGNKYLRAETYSNEDKPKYMFRIHNTNDLSGKNISIFEDLSEYANDEARIGKIAQAVSMNSFKYINNKVKYNPECNNISSVCEVNNVFDNGKYKKIKTNNQMILNTICPGRNNIEECLDIIRSEPLDPAPVEINPSILSLDGEQNDGETYIGGGRKHKKTKKRRRTKKKKTRKFKRAMRKKTIKKKKYA